ncbi:protein DETOXIFICATION 46, chloroplastic-like isoform X2 [Bidens hawaiensis]|uniref:protein DETOXIFICATION 46, chloroplastic-like isoform X2 n=1 Tax=Bidens hawaiensis TaxID=980011 RepID=UPI0040494E7A
MSIYKWTRVRYCRSRMGNNGVSGFMMVEALKDKGYNGYVVAAPSANELVQIFKLAAPVFIMMISKAPCMKIEDGERG